MQNDQFHCKWSTHHHPEEVDPSSEEEQILEEMYIIP